MSAPRCLVCAGRDTPVLERRARAPVLLHRTWATRADACGAPTGAIELRRCRACGFAWNAAFDPALVAYDPGYDNDQTQSAVFRAHVEERADALLARAEGRNLHIVEIGAGQGGFLAMLAERGGGRIASLTGFDPAWRGEAGEGPSGARLFRRLFDADAARLPPAPPDIVVSRHTIEHVADPAGFLRAIRAALGPGSRALLAIETPDFDWITRRGAIEDVFYEHCSLFSRAAMAHALAAAGFEDAAVLPVFSRQYLWATARAGRARPTPPASPGEPPGLDTDAFVTRWRERLASGAGPAVVWGAGAKGMTFAQTVDPEGDRLAALIDLNPRKHGRHVGLTGHPILGPEALGAVGAARAVVMNPNYMAEIAAHVAALGLEIELLPLH